MRLLTLLIALMQLQFVYSQNNTIDSLKLVLKNTKNSRERITIYSNIALEYSIIKPQIALKYIDSCKQKFNINDYQIVNHTITFALGNINLYNQNFDTALIYLHKALTITPQSEKKRIAKISANLGVLYKYLNKFEESEKFYNQAIVVFKNLEMRKELGIAYSNIAAIKADLSNYTQAIEYYYKSLEINEQLNNKQQLVITYYNLSIVLYENQQLDLSLKHANNSIKIAREIGDSIGIGDNLIHIASINWEKRKANEAIVMCNEALNIYKKIDNLFRVAYANRVLATFYLRAKDFVNAEKQFLIAIPLLKKFDFHQELVNTYRRFAELNIKINKPDKALKLLDTASYYLKNFPNPQEKFWIMKEKANANILLNNHKKASELLDSCINLNDSIFNLQKTKTITEYNVKYETQQKELQINQLALENEQKNTTILRLVLFSILIVIFGTVIFILLYLFNKKRERQLIIKIQESEKSRNFQYFHQLGNKLITISNEIEQTQNIKSTDLIKNLGQEIRHFSHQQYSPSFEKVNAKELLQEIIIEYQNYINGQVVFNNVVPDKTWKSLKQPLQLAIYRSVQELIQNAVKHAEATIIKLTVSKSKQNIQIFYQDNGIGADLKNINGKGIKYLTDLVNLFKGNVSIETEPQNGFLCTIEIPVKRFFIF